MAAGGRVGRRLTVGRRAHRARVETYGASIAACFTQQPAFKIAGQLHPDRDV
jgi:hypothetical protein